MSMEGATSNPDYKKMYKRTSAMAKIGVWECDLETGELIWSDTIYDLFEIPRGSTVERGAIVACYETASRQEMELLRSAAISNGTGFKVDVAIRTAKGNRRWLRLTADVEQENGKSVRIFGTKQDISEEKFAQEKVESLQSELVQLARIRAEKRDELTALYEQAPGFIATSMGPDHLITFANAAYKRFVNTDNLVGLTVRDALPNLAVDRFIDLLDEVYETGVAYVGTDAHFPFVDEATGQEVHRYADFVYQPIRSTDGLVTGLFCEGYDVTDKHFAAKRMAELQSEVIHLSRTNAMGTMAGTLAHELNQPLTAIGNYTEAARIYLEQNGAAGIRQASDAIEEIGDLTRRTGLLLKNLRNLTSYPRSQWVDFDMRAVVDESIRLVEAAAARPVRIVDLTTERLFAHGDPIQIQQVVVNLLRNASEAIDPSRPSEIKIQAARLEDRVRICVRDNGTGVCLTAVESLFTLYESSKPNGMGIGLSVSRTIVEGHGGHIWLEKSSSEGSEFCFTVPVATDQNQFSDQGA